MADDICRFLDWDTDFFERRIARLNTGKLTPDILAAADEYCRVQKIECLYFLADNDDAQTLRLAEANRFHFVDIRVTLERSSAESPMQKNNAILLRPWKAADLAELKAIARSSYRDSRFYYDGHFTTERCDLFYETWIERSCQGYAQHVLVAEHESKVAGFISCHLKGTDLSGQIGLVGVAAGAQGIGVGQELVAASLRCFSGQGVKHCEVVTQGRNIRAQRLYQRAGFLMRSVQLWFHRWFPR